MEGLVMGGLRLTTVARAAVHQAQRALTTPRQETGTSSELGFGRFAIDPKGAA
jgi:hypothetical protein